MKWKFVISILTSLIIVFMGGWYIGHKPEPPTIIIKPISDSLKNANKELEKIIESNWIKIKEDSIKISKLKRPIYEKVIVPNFFSNPELDSLFAKRYPVDDKTSEGSME